MNTQVGCDAIARALSVRYSYLAVWRAGAVLILGERVKMLFYGTLYIVRHLLVLHLSPLPSECTC